MEKENPNGSSPNTGLLGKRLLKDCAYVCVCVCVCMCFSYSVISVRLQSSAVREINDRNEAMVCLLILSTSSLYIARITNVDGCTR